MLKKQSNEEMFDELESRKEMLENAVEEYRNMIDVKEDQCVSIAGDLQKLTEDESSIPAEIKVLEKDFKSQGAAIKDLKKKRQTKAVKAQIAELAKQRKENSRTRSELKKKLSEIPGTIDSLNVKIENHKSEIRKLKVMISDSEDEIKRVNMTIPQLGIHALLDEMCDEFFECTYAEFCDEFPNFSEPIKKEIESILDKAEPVLQFALTNIYDRYIRIRESLHESRMSAINMTAKNEAEYFLTLCGAGVPEKIALKMMKNKFGSPFDVVDSLFYRLVKKSSKEIMELLD